MLDINHQETGPDLIQDLHSLSVTIRLQAFTHQSNSYNNPQQRSEPQVWVATKVMYQAKTNKYNNLSAKIIETVNNSTLKEAAIINSSPNQCYSLPRVIKTNRKYSKCVQNQLAVNKTTQQQQPHHNWFTEVSLKNLNLKLWIG
jgi:hypothetical protein